MVSTPYTLTPAWTPTNSHPAVDICEMLVSNTASTDIRWARTPAETQPALEPRKAHLLRPGRSQVVRCDVGETLWLAGSPKGRAVIDVFELDLEPGGGTPDPGPMTASRGTLSGMEPGQDGDEIRAGGIGYIWATGATAIPDLPGLLPVAPVMLEHFGAKGDGVSKDTAAWNAAMDYLESQGGGVLLGGLGKTYCLTETTIASGVIFQGQGEGVTTLKVHPDTTLGEVWLGNRDINKTGPDRDARDIAIVNCTLDGTDLPFSRWLAQADGTPVTDPEEDYRPGSGALGAGISGVSLAATVVGNQITDVVINNGGSGWNSHPTHPYQADTVNLYFEGGSGRGAQAVATIENGTLSSVIVQDGGYGYSGTPVVWPMGGYADVSLLATPEVDRRNPDFEAVGSGLSFSKVVSPRVENVVFRNFHCRALADGGCLRGVYRNLRFENCGKSDGAYHCIWVQSYGNPENPLASYAPSDGTLVEDVTVIDAERSAIAFMPAKGGTLRRLYASGCGESTVFINSRVCYNGGQALIEDCVLKDNVLTDIASQLIESDARNVTVRNCLLEGASNKALVATGSHNYIIENCTFRNNNTGLTTTGNYRLPFGPFSERFNYNQGSVPVCGTGINIRTEAVISVGTSSAGGCDNVRFEGNTFIKTRPGYPSHIFRQARAGGSNQSGDLTVRGNDLRNIPAGMGLWDMTIGNVFKPTMPLHIAYNLGHASEAPVNIDQVLTGTGPFEIRPGFRPKSVRVFAHTNQVNDLSTALGEFSWRRSGVRNDFTWAFTTDAAGTTKTWFYDSDIVRLVNAAAAQVCRVEFVSWMEDGFRLNTVLLEETCTLRFVCCP